MLTRTSWLTLCGATAFAAALLTALPEHHELIGAINYVFVAVFWIVDFVGTVVYWDEEPGIGPQYWAVRSVLAGIQIGIVVAVSFFEGFYATGLLLTTGCLLATIANYYRASGKP